MLAIFVIHSISIKGRLYIKGYILSIKSFLNIQQRCISDVWGSRYLKTHDSKNNFLKLVDLKR